MSVMEIYNRRGGWLLGLILSAVAAVVLMAQLEVITLNNAPSKTVGYSIFAVIVFLALLVFFARTRMYFDNKECACIQERTHFWWTKRLVFPYASILNIVVCQSRNTHDNVGGYEVGFNQATRLLGQSAKRYTQLQYFGKTEQDYNEAVLFAHTICEYSGLTYLDDASIVRPL